MKKVFILTGMLVALVTSSYAQQKIPPPKPVRNVMEPPPPPKVEITKFSAPSPPKVEVTKFATPPIKKKPSFRKLKKPVSKKSMPKGNMTKIKPPLIVRDSAKSQ